MLGLIATRDSSAAAGWFRLEFRSDGLYAADIEWTPSAFESIKNREYRFTSPALVLQETDEMGVLRAAELINVAVTNLPATVGQRPLVASETTTDQKEAEMPFPKELLKRLGLKEDATEEQVSEAIEALNAKSDKVDTLTAERDEAVQLAETATQQAEAKKAEADAAKAEKTELLGATGTESLSALRERIAKLEKTEQVATELSTRVATLEADQTQAKWQATFDELDSKGKMPDSLHDWAKTQSAEQLSAWGQGAPVVHQGRTESATRQTSAGGTTVLSSEDRQVMRLMGISDEQGFLQARTEENKPVISADQAQTTWMMSTAERNKKCGRMITAYLSGEAA
jgi:phage I-like protein